MASQERLSLRGISGSWIGPKRSPTARVRVGWGVPGIRKCAVSQRECPPGYLPKPLSPKGICHGKRPSRPITCDGQLRAAMSACFHLQSTLSGCRLREFSTIWTYNPSENQKLVFVINELPFRRVAKIVYKRLVIFDSHRPWVSLST